jgi:hypothetical protein
LPNLYLDPITIWWIFTFTLFTATIGRPDQSLQKVAWSL